MDELRVILCAVVEIIIAIILQLYSCHKVCVFDRLINVKHLPAREGRRCTKPLNTKQMNDYDKIMESVNHTTGLILGLIFDIIKLIFFGALAIELLFN